MNGQNRIITDTQSQHDIKKTGRRLFKNCRVWIKMYQKAEVKSQSGNIIAQEMMREGVSEW